MKRFTQSVQAATTDALDTPKEYLYHHMRQLGYAPVAGTEKYEGKAPRFKIVVLGKKHNDAESINYVTFGGNIEWL